MRLIFVDDSESWIDLFDTAIADWNEKNPEKQFCCDAYKTIDEADRVLLERRYDGALFDLKIPAAPGSTSSGNTLAERTLTDLGMPLGILSGHPEDRSELLHDNPLVRAFQKEGGVCDEVVGWFGSQWSMMATLRLARAEVRKLAADIFATRIWPRWTDYMDIKIEGISKERIITRQFAYHIAESMGVDGTNNPDWHPYENYIYPALLDGRAHTGDIFDLNGSLWVVLTPQCDMATGTADPILLAQCDKSPPEHWNEKCTALSEALKGVGNGAVPRKISDYFLRYVNQNVKPSEHFLAPIDGTPVLVNFKILKTVTSGEIQDALSSRVASVAPPFLINLTQRFASYMARPGQPNIDFRHFAK